MSMANAKSVIFDVLFTESQKAFSEEEMEDSRYNDQLLAQGTLEYGAAVHAFKLAIDKLATNDDDGFIAPKLPQHTIDQFSIDWDGPEVKKVTDYFLPYDDLLIATNRLGFVDVDSDSDGIFRRVELLRQYQGHVFPSLSFAGLLASMKTNQVSLDPGKNLIVNELAIPLAADQTYLIKMKNDFPVYSAGAVFQSIQALYQGRIEDMIISPDTFENKIVFFGVSAAGTHDLLNTSIQSNIPGIYIHASILDNLLLEDFYQPLPFWVSCCIALAIILLTGSAVFFITSFYVQIFCLLGILAGVIASHLGVFVSQSLVLLMAFPLVSFLLMTLNCYGYLALTEGAEKRKVRGMLSKYVSPNVLTEVLDPSTESLIPEVGKKETLTIFFSDIRSFTSLSESLEAEQVVLILNQYLSKMVDIVFKYNGTLDKFIGDAIMAFWGAPVKNPQHAFDGVAAALEMVNSQEELNIALNENGWPSVNFGIGLHSGPVILGNIGSVKHLDYTIIGDNVNLGSRIEGLTKYYGCAILITEFTYNDVNDRILCRPVDIVQVKGKTKGIMIYEPLCLIDQETDEYTDIAKVTVQGVSVLSSTTVG